MFPPHLPKGEFIDYFSLAMGILALEWLEEPIDLIPETFAHTFWVWNSEEVTALEPYERLLLLLKIFDEARPETEVEIRLWKALKVSSFIQTGDIPQRGTVPRLILCAFLERSPEHHDIIDRQFYLKIREHARFTSLELSLKGIYNEVIAPLPGTWMKMPVVGDRIAVRHPVSDEWVTAQCKSCKNGRVVVKSGTDEVQLPMVGIYWDARAGWSEAKSRVTPTQPKLKPRAQSEMAGGPFVTLSETTKDEEEPKPEPAPKQQFPVLAEPPRSDTRLLLQSGIRLMNTSKFIDRTIDRTIDRPATFKGVRTVIHPWRPTIVRSAPTRRPIQFVQDVVNITLGADLGHGKRLRKFNVRVENAITNRSTYLWIPEDEVAKDDVEKLVQLYRNHIESKMTIIPGI
jgi:hypothetical protein